MLRIFCPFCGPRDHSEFTYGGDATVEYPPLDADPEVWFDAVFLRDNPRGAHREYWHHASGCRAFLVVERDTATHAITSARLAHGPTADALAGGGR